MQGGGGSPEQSQRVVFGYQLDENYSQTSARRGRPRSYAQARALAFNAKGEKPAEPVLSKQSVLADAVKSNVKDGAPAPVRASETGRARNWTMPPLRLERECKEHSAEQNDLLSFCERRNSATIDNRCVEFDRRENQRCAFTMAEILLSLTIIGVVAAITLPSLTGNINERTWNTQRKALYARFSQAIALMPSLNGYGTLRENTDSAGSTSIEDTAAETFITDGLAKVLKINNICDNEHLQDCGLPESITPLVGSAFSFPLDMKNLNSAITSVTTTEGAAAGGSRTYSQINTKAAAFETQNGESIAVYYNPNCLSSLYEDELSFTQTLLCANFIYDLNGQKGPNTVGKDIGFMTAFYPTDTSVVAPYPYVRDASGTYNWNDAISQCKAIDDEYRLPNRDEATSMFINKKLLGTTASTNQYWTSTVYDSENAWHQGFATGTRYPWPKSERRSVRCVKR